MGTLQWGMVGLTGETSVGVIVVVRVGKMREYKERWKTCSGEVRESQEEDE